MKLKIEVTDDDVYAGQQCKSDKCPIALAFNRVTEGKYKNKFAVTLDEIVILEKEREFGIALVLQKPSFKMTLPHNARSFISQYDSGMLEVTKNNQFSFEIEHEKLV